MGKAGNGFKKPQKKSYFTKKDIIGTVIAAVAVVAIVVVLALVIGHDDFIRRDSDGNLRMEDNWLVANYSKTSVPQYYKIGEIGNVEGYALDVTVSNSVTKLLTPVEEDSDLPSLYVYATELEYMDALKRAQEGALPVENPVYFTCAGRDAAYVLCDLGSVENFDDVENIVPEDIPAETGEPAETEETAAPEESVEPEETVVPEADAMEGTVVWAFIDYDDTHCLCVYAASDSILQDAEIQKLLNSVGDAITLEQR